jgi:uncharacterized protein DUF6973
MSGKRLWLVAALATATGAVLLTSHQNPVGELVRPVANTGVPGEVVAGNQLHVYELPQDNDSPDRKLNDLGLPGKAAKVTVTCWLTGEPIPKAVVRKPGGPVQADSRWFQLSASPAGTRNAAKGTRLVLPALAVQLTTADVPECSEHKMFGLTPAERQTCLANLAGCAEMERAREFAINRKDDLVAPVNKGSDDANDAARHCLWQVHITVFAGRDVAKAAGDAHETTAGTTESHLMDQHNNEVAMNLAADKWIAAARARDVQAGKAATGKRPGPQFPTDARTENAIAEVCRTAVRAAVQVSYDGTWKGDAALVPVAHAPTKGRLVFLKG